MSEAVSALPGAEYAGAVTVREAGLRGMITVRGDLGSAAMKEAVKAATGYVVPDQRGVKSKGEKGVAWMSPDELLILVPYAEAEPAVAKMQDALAGEHSLVVNVSDARAVFTLTGAGWREVLAKGAPGDIAPDAFGQGEARRTRIGQIAAAFWISGEEEVTIVCFRSVAEFMFEWLSTASREGSLPGYF